jgi:hypothetical protein
MFQESQVERTKHQDDAYIGHEPLPEAIPKDEEIDADHNHDHYDDIEKDQRVLRHRDLLAK